jgi:hypothetical protein
MEMMNFLFNENLGMDYNNKKDFELIKTETLIKLKETMLRWVNDHAFEINRKMSSKHLDKYLSEVKLINKVYNFILDEMDERTSAFTFDDIVIYRHQMNKANKGFYDVYKLKVNN